MRVGRGGRKQKSFARCTHRSGHRAHNTNAALALLPTALPKLPHPPLFSDVLEHILSQENCDVDPINRLEGATPLHLALKLEDEALKLHVVESLLDAGADTKYVTNPLRDIVTFTNLLMPRLKDKNGSTVLDIVPADDTEVRTMIRKAQASSSVSHADIASGE